jgi:hypothetical protein
MAMKTYHTADQRQTDLYEQSNNCNTGDQATLMSVDRLRISSLQGTAPTVVHCCTLSLCCGCESTSYQHMHTDQPAANNHKMNKTAKTATAGRVQPSM